MSAPTYILKTIDDIRQVPVDRRERCMRELQYALNLADLGGAGPSAQFEWTDDGDMTSELCDLDGTPVLTLRVTKGGAA